jgi:CBS domain containing-hemolysin-like protein
VLVHEGDLDRVVGLVHAKDVLLLDPAARSTTTARTLMRAVAVTHENRLIEDQLVEMRTGRQHLAVVVDEHGVVGGVVTLEDVVEELIGDFEDETDRRDRRCRRLGDGSYSLVGHLRPDELTQRTGIALPEGDWETIAGFVIGTLERMPIEGDTITSPGVVFTVTRVDGYAVAEVHMQTGPLPTPGRPSLG